MFGIFLARLNHIGGTLITLDLVHKSVSVICTVMHGISSSQLRESFMKRVSRQFDPSIRPLKRLSHSFLGKGTLDEKDPHGSDFRHEGIYVSPVFG
jgi:hypothetical protein